MIRSELMPFNLQFFAEAGTEGTGDTGTGDAGTGIGAEGSTGNQEPGKTGSTTTYTQEDLNRIGKQEKESGKKSALKSLGFEDEKSAKAQLDEFKAWKESQKTEAQKTADAIAASAKETEAAKTEAALLKNTLAVIKLGVAVESVDDVLALAMPKVSETLTLEKVVENMKKEAKYASLFGAVDPASKGTGNSVGGKAGATGGSNPSGVGERLGKQANETKQQKSTYFSH